MIADQFHVLPNVVINDLLDDPEQTAIQAITLLRYAEAYRAFDSGDERLLKAWEGSDLMSIVTRNAFDIHNERRARRGTPK